MFSFALDFNKFLIAAFGASALLYGQPAPKPASERPVPVQDKQIATPDPAETRRRIELNLLGKENAAAGESRRNENIQFNLVDNNALKELNVRLGATATIIEFFRPERGYFGSEFGNAPSSSIHVASSAASSWHGSLFAIHQNSVFSARSFFQVGDVRPARDNRYGFSTGFVPWTGGYFSIQGSQEHLRGNVNGNVLVPQADERTPLTNIPERRALVERFLSAYPTQAPNRTDINPRALNTNAPQIIDNQDAAVRLEHDITSRDRILMNYQFVAQAVDAFQLVAGQNPNTDTKSHRARITWSRQWTPGASSAFSAGFDRIGSLLLPDETSVGPMISTAGLQTLGPAGSIPIDRAQNLYRYEGGFTAARQAHTWTAGFALVRRQFNGIETDAHRGFFSFSNDFGRSGIDNLRHGTPSQHIISIGDVHRGFRQWLPQFYADDTWRATQNLTLQLGLRYEPVSRPLEVNNLNQIPYDCDCNNLAPRFGFAYRLPRLWGVLRGAYGLHYGEILPVTYSQIRLSPPGSVKLVIPAPDLLDPLSGIKQTGEQADARGNLYLLDPELASPYSHQYNFSWEPALSATWRIQLGYVGSRSHKLLIMWYLNRAHPLPGVPQTTATINQRRPRSDLADVRWVLNGSRGYFDAARATLVARRLHGFTFEAAYWFSKAMDLGADYTNTAYEADSRLSRSQSEFETHSDRKALSLFDQSHSFLTRATY
ncbi:MAG: TonB-dependent receptor, partial [Bryobacteraceae bacterium]